MTANSSGQRTAEQTYYPYGAVRTGSLPTDYTFTGQKLDTSDSLLYYGARYYAADIGRFAQPDSMVPNLYNPQSLNRYSYVGNNPARYRDPDGRCWPVCTAIAGAVIGGIGGAAWVAVPQMIYNIQSGQPLTANIEPGEVVKAAAVGAVAGAVGGATFGVGTAVLGTGLGATIATGAVAGALAGQASIATENVLNGQEMTSGLGNPSDIVRDAAVGGATAGVVKVGGSVLAQHAEQRAVTTLYRAVDDVEAADIKATGVFRPGARSLSGGKWFGETSEVANKYADYYELTKMASGDFPTAVVEQSEYRPNLDGFGPSWWLSLEDLSSAQDIEVFDVVQ